MPSRRRSSNVLAQCGLAASTEIGDMAQPITRPDARRTIVCKGISLFKLAIIEEKDVKTVSAARGRLSEEMHMSAETLNPETVSHPDLVAEVVKLENWLTSIMQRQQDEGTRDFVRLSGRNAEIRWAKRQADWQVVIESCPRSKNPRVR